MPVPQVPEALAQGVIDGCVLAWEAVPTLKIHELVKFHTEIPGSPTLSTTSFLLAMNKARYESLPGDLKAVIDANSGLRPAADAGAIWDNEADGGHRPGPQAEEHDRIAAGGEREVLAQEASSRSTTPGSSRSPTRGQNGQKLLESARELVAKYESA